MNSENTQAAARGELYRYLRGVLEVLPAGAELSLSHPELPHAQLHSGVVLPYDDAGSEADTEFFDIAYWLNGVSAEAAESHFGRILDSWRRSGWPTRTDDRDEPPRAAYARTPDGFGLSVRESVGGYVSVSGSTPPFTPDTPAGDPLPETIERPLSGGRPGNSQPAEYQVLPVDPLRPE